MAWRAPLGSALARHHAVAWRGPLGLALCLAAAACGGCEPAEAPNKSCIDAGPSDLDCLRARLDNSWITQLSPDPEQDLYTPNKEAREVASGHFVLVRPSPLPEAYLVAYSAEVASLLGLREEVCLEEDFVRLFAGEVRRFGPSWATPYALSIYGQEMQPNGAGAEGNGYGDGRAISIGEVLATNCSRWELQLKGSGTTPFCRGSDGRAVLRSSVREFLASEAMHHLGVPTTRALSLVASGSERAARPWYSEAEGAGVASRWGPGGAEKHGGDVMREERCAMTTRVAPSFLRVGHFELFGRRARRGNPTGLRQLEALARHALFREYPHQAEGLGEPGGPSLQQCLLNMLAEAKDRFAQLAADWVRVGYVQSNFNADNCLISGRTMDYGPFGFVERYEPGWGMWIHAGEHFSFMNQPQAAGKNFEMFAESLLPLMDENGAQELRRIVDGYASASRRALDRMWARKLGLRDVSEASALWAELEPLLRQQPTDWTIFWRQLAELPATLVRAAGLEAGEVEEALALLRPALRSPPAARAAWARWLRRWAAALAAEGGAAEAAAAMRRASPRYVPRESMLREAYSAAERGDHSPLRALQELFRRPYEEQPFFGERYYRLQEPGSEQVGGLGFMS